MPDTLILSCLEGIQHLADNVSPWAQQGSPQRVPQTSMLKGGEDDETEVENKDYNGIDCAVFASNTFFYKPLLGYPN